VTPEELAAIRAGAETALDAVHRGWPWPEIDNDLVIGVALKDVSALVAEVERLRAALAPFLNAPKRFPGGQRPFVHVVVTEHDLDAAQEVLCARIHAADKLP
jgi:hypothetical protein